MTDFYKGKKVLITGHTGFKGTWLTTILVKAGAEVLGYSRCSEKNPSLFALSGVEQSITHVKGDIRDRAALEKLFLMFRPLLVKRSCINGIFDEDLFQINCETLLRCVRSYRIEM